MFSYSPEQDDELPLDVGDVLDFIEEVEEGWWRGKLKGREGIFPSNFVEEVEEPKTNGGFVETGHAHPVATKQGEEPPKQKETIRNSLSKGIAIEKLFVAIYFCMKIYIYVNFCILHDFRFFVFLFIFVND